MLGAKELVNKIGRVFAHIDLTFWLMKKHNKEVANTNEDSGSDNEYLVDDGESARRRKGEEHSSRGASLGKVKGGSHLGVRNRRPAKPDTLDTRKKNLRGQTGRWEGKEDFIGRSQQGVGIPALLRS